MNPPTLVVAAHRRPEALRRLLASLARAEVVADTALIVSIDGGHGTAADVGRVADDFDWPSGPFSIVEHESLGLVEHFYRCGDLSAEHGSVVLLEDDMVVGPSFHRWATAALDHVQSDDRIAGISLAAPHFDGYRHLPFEPVIDGSDGFYAQVPWYDGMAWTAEMWDRFRSHKCSPQTAIHASLQALADDEWFPDAMRYLVESNRYYLLPHQAQAGNTGAPGAHFDHQTDYFQVPLTLRGPATWSLHGLDESLAVYDDHMELAPHVLKALVAGLDGYDLTVDMLGVRSLEVVTTPHVVTTRRVTRAIRTWGASMHPLVANLVYDVPGDAIRLASAADVVEGVKSLDESFATLRKHATRGRVPSTRDSARLLAQNLKRKSRLGR